MPTLWCRAAVLAALTLLAGCATQPLLPPLVESNQPASVELDQTPFFPQQAYQCGPAALATVLTASGVAVTDQDLVPDVYLPARQGSLQVELVAASRRHGRIPYRIDGNPGAIIDEIQAGRPVLVLQNLALVHWPYWHYAVVVGYDAGQDQFILRSGDQRRRRVRAIRFDKTWERAGRWAIVTLKPGDIPAHVDHDRYVKAVADFERNGSLARAAAAYRGALARFADDPALLFGLANIQLERKRPREAIALYRKVLAIKPAFTAARNNLALALARSGCAADAEHQIEQALAQPGSEAQFRDELLRTRAEIQTLSDSGAKRPGADCARPRPAN